ncbi:GspG family T2SS major pseudopilin variant XcpT [Prosthecobacter algae]|jgi:general secretion pathway protein G|uniref:Type II secretion system core protein G n=1 Tax=Prosthecobacter algae TaxID=1144682 RepID=A0ABP9PBH1_9BACT
MKMRTHSSKLRHARSAGFTLVEMVLVLGIVALLVGAGIVSLVGVLDSGKKTRVKADLNTLTAAFRSYETDNMFLPSTEQGVMALVQKPASRPAPVNYTPKLKKLLLDPWGNPYHYKRPGAKDKGGFDVYSAGADGLADTADDIGNWDL